MNRRRSRALMAVAAGVAAIAIGTGGWVAWPLPPELARPGPAPSLTLLDRHGLELRTTRAPDGSRGGWIPLDAVDPDLLRAFIAMEDERFFRHSGVDLLAVARALRDNLRAGRVVSGASTITMQTARLLRPIPRTWTGKVSQALWALRLDAHLGKQTILEVYLNRLPLGQGTVGVAAAASLYCDASAAELSLGQAALLAALAHAPSQDNPLVAPARAAARRARVLERLAALGWAGADDVARALEEPLVARERRTPFFAPHFTTHALEWAEREGGGLSLEGIWRTTLDLELQLALEAEVRHTVDVLAERRVEHAAAVVIENASGAILAWVGSPDFWADTAGQVDMVISRRQPGSALKPFLYALAFDRGLTPASILADVPRSFTTLAGIYRPRNYDRLFHGPVRAREALASSYNVPAVDLVDRLGLTSFLATLHLAGFESLEQSAEHYGVGLALGNGDVTLLELANAYRALALGGVWRPYRWRAAEDGAPQLEDGAGRRFVSARAAATVLDILSDPVARIPGFGVNTVLDFPFPVAAKTGTSRRFTDNWAVGVTGTFTVAVWTGNFSGRPMAAVSGITGAGPLLQRAVLLVARRYPPGTLTTPAEAGNVAAEICRVSGLAPGRDCPRAVEWFAPGSEPRRACDWHRDGQLVLPAEYAEWLGQRLEADGEGPGPDAGAVTLASTAVAEPVAPPPPAPPAARFRIVTPQDGDVYGRVPGVDPRYSTIALRAVGALDAGPVRWWVDGVEMRTSRWRLEPGRHTVRAAAASGEWDEVTITVEPN